MANISLLIFTNTRDPEQTTSVDENFYFAKYVYPLFWLACFTTDDIQKFETTKDEEYVLPYYYFVATKEKCIEVFRSRLPFLNTVYQGHLDELANQFMLFLEGKACDYIIVRIDDVLALEINPGGDEAKAEMIRLLSAFNNSAESPWYPLLEDLQHDSRSLLDGLYSDVLPAPSFDHWLSLRPPVSASVSVEADIQFSYFYIIAVVVTLLALTIAVGYWLSPPAGLIMLIGLFIAWFVLGR